ncbi:MAG: hypothetical protein HZB91_00325 [Elusimicrobia bacterium]|nr:hypothetical protein [Elusimicrobiota bacterium]
MLFIKRQLPLIVCFTVGVLVAVQYYVPHKISQDFIEGLSHWEIIIAAFAFFLGLVSVTQVHVAKLRRRTPGWGFSLFFFGGILIGVVTGFLSRGKQITEAGAITSFGWMYNNMLNPLQGTMFCLLGFYIVSAAYRAFKVRSLQAGVLLAVAVLFIFSRVPLGQYLWEATIGGMFPWQLHQIVEWVMNTPAKAAGRGILIGVSLGAVATSVKIIAGIERQYMGGKD